MSEPSSENATGFQSNCGSAGSAAKRSLPSICHARSAVSAWCSRQGYEKLRSPRPPYLPPRRSSPSLSAIPARSDPKETRMRRRAKPAKAKGKAKLPPAPTSPKIEDARVRDLEKRLAEALKAKAAASEQLERRDRDLNEALEQRTATGEILRVIASFPADLQPVLDAMAESAARLCASHDASIFRLDGDVLRSVAHHGPLRGAPAGLEIPAIRGTVTGRSVVDRQTIQVVDLQTAVDEFPEGTKFAQEFGFRTYASVPLLREGIAIGAIGLRRTEREPFTDAQIALMQTFADQAVIAIENVRLFKELAEKNRALASAHALVSESLEQQTATSEILRVISSSPTDTQPVFETIAATALRLCNAKLCTVFKFDGKLIHLVALHQVSTEGAAAYRDAYPAPPGRAGGTHRAILTRSIVHIPDVREDPEYELQALARANDFGCVLSVPMLRDGQPVGAITVGREAGRSFSDEQIELLQTFASQALIAIENVRLFNETKEALERETAMGEILRVISGSPTDIQPVLDAVAESAARLCESSDADIWRRADDRLLLVAHYGPIPVGPVSEYGLPLVPGTVGGRSMLETRPVQVADVQAAADEFPESAENARRTGFRTILSVPLVREGVAIGAISLRRTEV